MNLLQHLVDVDGVGLLPLTLALLVSLGDVLLGLAGLLGGLSAGLGRHVGVSTSKHIRDRRKLSRCSGGRLAVMCCGPAGVAGNKTRFWLSQPLDYAQLRLRR